jgi:hypothetical protein
VSVCGAILGAILGPDRYMADPDYMTPSDWVIAEREMPGFELDMIALRRHARSLGVIVDERWSEARLRRAIAEAAK